MSGITSGVGLVSGLPTAELIDSIIASASRPRDLLQQRLETLNTQRTSLTDLNARLVALGASSASFEKADFFNQFSATSSNDDVLKATATEDALPGVIDLVVKSLVTSHQMVSGGFADPNRTPVGIGEISIEFAEARVNRPTLLGDLNGGEGIRRGTIRITDRSGESADIDLSSAIDLSEVIDLINNESAVDVKARISGNHLVIEDTSDGEGTLNVTDLKGGFAAKDLGILQSSETGAITGSDLVQLRDNTLLSVLNDGNGIRRNGAGLDDFTISTAGGDSFDVALSVSTLQDDFDLSMLNSGNGVRLGVLRITNRLGETGTVDLTGATTIGEVKERFNAAVSEDTGQPLNVTLKTGVGVAGVASLSIEDTTEPDEDRAQALTIEDVSGYAARDLGIAASTESANISGNGIYRIETIGDVVRAINFADGNDGQVVASLTEDGIQITDNTLGPNGLTIEAIANAAGRFSSAAADLGIAGELDGSYTSRPLLSGLNTVMLSTLNGGNGIETGSIAFQSRDGADPVLVDFTGATTLQDIIERINTSVPGIQAEVNGVGTGISIIDTTDGTASDLVIQDVSGTLAAQLGIAGSFAESSTTGSDLERQYINETTKLDKVNGGRGVRAGTLRITNSNEQTFTVEIRDSVTTFGGVIDAINSAGASLGINATINATGDGIVINDTSGGESALIIEDEDGGSTAEDLRIAGKSKFGETNIDGSYEIHIEVDADDSLNAVAGKIRDASADVSASVFNDGASGTPYRLSLNSGITGRRGEMLFDTGTTNLNMSTLVEAQDAVVLVGGRGATNPIVVSSSTNTISGAIPGVELELTSVSDETITISTARNIDGIVTNLQGFVDSYNDVIDRIDELTAYDQETEQRAPLQGDSTVALIENRLSRALIGRFEGVPLDTSTLASVGIKFGDGAHLSFDEDVFREKYATDPEAVTRLFTAEDTGVGAVINAALDSLIEDETGLLARRDDVIGNQVDDLEDRIASADEQLDRRREQLERQYANLESVLAGLQDQQSALSQLTQLGG